MNTSMIMDTKNQEEEEVEVEEPLDLPEVQEGEEDTTNWKGEALKLRDKAIAQRERTKALKQQLADAKKAVEVVATSTTRTQPKTGELDETQLDYLDLKGVSEDDDVKLIQQVMQRTGITVRQALKDEYVVSKLDANKQARETKAAMPTSTKRTGSGADNSLDLAIARYEQSGFKELPQDTTLRRQVVNAMKDKVDSNKPSWG